MLIVNLPSFVEALIPLCGGVVATVFAIRDRSASHSATRRGIARRQLKWCGPLLIVIGLLSLSKALVPSRPTAESVAAAFRNANRLPLRVDQLTTLDAVDGHRQRVTFISTINKPGANREEVSSLVSSIEFGVRRHAVQTQSSEKSSKVGSLLSTYTFLMGRIFPASSLLQQTVRSDATLSIRRIASS